MQNNEDSIAAHKDITDDAPTKEGDATIKSVNDPVSRTNKKKELFLQG